MRMHRLVASTAVAAAVGVCSATADTGTAAAASGCPALYVVAIPGTWETGSDRRTTGPGMLSGVTDELPDSEQVVYVDYPATAFPWEGKAYGASKKIAVDTARSLIYQLEQHCADARFALVGYSQGADAAGDLAAEIGGGSSVVAPDRIAGVGLLSDPRRSPTDIQVGPAVPGSGVRGSRPGGFGSITPRVRTICAAGDLYCSTDEEDFITRVASTLGGVTDDSPESMQRYRIEATALLTELRSEHDGPAASPEEDQKAASRRAIELGRFYGSGTHMSYGTYLVGDGKSSIRWLHDWVASLG
ncbi:cutinase family protein [Nocardia sp. NPDC057663]|uniref:cutinase family protein n=1 Tax=Nocardia sp. NPDC057663 TaxID=3346201 RepID=UPI00366CC979